MDSLIDKTTPRKLTLALEKLPKGSEALDYAYMEGMERIEGQSTGFRELAKRVLSWITCAKRPLTTSELRHALAVEIGESELNKDNFEETEDMVSVCAGLVTVNKESDVIRLVHYTTQEYFERTWTSWFPDAQRDIATACVKYLSFDAFETGFCQTDKEFEARLQSHALYDYAARNWGYHVREALIEVEQLILDFLLRSKAKVSGSSQAMVAASGYPGYSQTMPKQMAGVHVAAYFGLREAMTALLATDGIDPDSKNDYGQTPLSWAAENGHEAVVKLLLATDGVDPDPKDSQGQTALSWAAANGHEAVVKLLLATDGVDPDSKDSGGRTPLPRAAAN